MHYYCCLQHGLIRLLHTKTSQHIISILDNLDTAKASTFLPLIYHWHSLSYAVAISYAWEGSVNCVNQGKHSFKYHLLL